jgi:hypothetical protein
MFFTLKNYIYKKRPVRGLFSFALMQKKQKIKSWILGGQNTSQSLKEMNSAKASNSISFYDFFDCLTLACES